MGFYSFTCAKTGLPVMAGSVASAEEIHLCEVAVHFEEGDSCHGVYDGYGRVGSMDVGDLISSGKAKMVLSRFHDGETFKTLSGVSHDDPKQGYFHDWAFVGSAFNLIDFARNHPDSVHADPAVSTEFARRDRELDLIFDAMNTHMSGLLGMPLHVVQEVQRSMSRDIDAQYDLSLWQMEWADRVEAKRDMLPSGSLLLTMPPAFALMAVDAAQTMLERAARREVINAWRDGCPARFPDVEALLSNPLNVNAWSGEALSKAKTTQPRP